ncbi:putative predicted protein [Rhizobium favelukesii]|uniref:Uncharacterized protein n=1 Tax=Rhizobium favelukesii TaxID=348824 RepID=W6RTT4_9HYPH|nr:putative predicted protein [Rhizobium favelukesii]
MSQLAKSTFRSAGRLPGHSFGAFATAAFERDPHSFKATVS